jgi:hypothetical protein
VGTVGVGATGGAASPDGAGAALAAQAVAVGDRAAGAGEPAGPERVGGRTVRLGLVVSGLVGGLVRVVVRHGADVLAPGRYAITTRSDRAETSLVRS